MRSMITACLFLCASFSVMAALEEEFRNPPAWTKPWSYWFWMDGDVTEEGITKDLEIMAELGIQRAIIMNVHHGKKKQTGPVVKTHSTQWRELTRYALREAKRVGVEFAMFNCAGWSQSGGPWNTPEHSMRFVTWNEVEAQGGDFRHDIRPKGIHVQDIAVLAVPRTGSVTIRKLCRTKELTFTHTAPFAARSLSFSPNKDNYAFAATLYAKQPAGKQVPVREFREAVRGRNAKTSFLPLGPETFSFKTVRARTFILKIRHAAGVDHVELSSEPKVAQVVEKQLGRMHPTPKPRWDTYFFPDTVEPDNPGQIIDSKRILNLSDKLASDGVLSCQLPPGQWTVIYFGMTPTGKRNHPAAPEATGLECDKMSRAAIKHHFNSMFSQLFSEMSPLEKSALKGVTVDSYEVGSQNWTDNFELEFKARVGYDPVPWLPVLTGRVVGSARDSDLFLWNLRRQVADLISINYVGELREICHKHGLTLWLENYGHWGYPGEFLMYGGYSDDVAGEFWSTGTLGNIECRAASSSGHIYGKKRIYAEAYTSGLNLRHHPAFFKSRGERMFCDGINHFVLNGQQKERSISSDLRSRCEPLI